MATKDVQAQVLEVAGLDMAAGIPHPGDGRSREVERVFVEVQHYLADIGIHDVGGRPDWGGHRGNCGLLLARETPHRPSPPRWRQSTRRPPAGERPPAST